MPENIMERGAWWQGTPPGAWWRVRSGAEWIRCFLNIVNTESTHISSICKCGIMLILKRWYFIVPFSTTVLLYNSTSHSFVSLLVNCAFVHTEVSTDIRNKFASLNPRIALFSQRVFFSESCPGEIAKSWLFATGVGLEEGSIAYDSTTA